MRKPQRWNQPFPLHDASALTVPKDKVVCFSLFRGGPLDICAHVLRTRLFSRITIILKCKLSAVQLCTGPARSGRARPPADSHLRWTLVAAPRAHSHYSHHPVSMACVNVTACAAAAAGRWLRCIIPIIGFCTSPL